MLSFLFGKKKNQPATEWRLPILWDMHSHILPGIDDGSPDLATSISLVKGLKALGIERCIATPHVISDLYRNTPETIQSALDVLRQGLIQEQIDFSVSAAAEYMLDDFFLRMLSEGRPLLTVHQNLILTEQSYAAPTGNLHEIAYKIAKAGYKPIMAHPERYNFYHNKWHEYERLKEMGFRLQVNLLSITGYYGPVVAKAAKFILKEQLADYVGTDLHHARHLHALQDPKHLQVIQQACQGRFTYQLQMP